MPKQLDLFDLLNTFLDIGSHKVKPKAPRRPRPTVLPARKETSDFALSGHIPYKFRRGKRKNITYYFTVHGLEVAAPKWVSLTQIEAGIEEKRGWIERKLEERRKWREEHGLPKVRFENGGKLPFRGGTLTISLEATAVTQIVQDGNVWTLRLALPTGAGEEQIKDAVHDFYRKEAERVLGERLAIVGERAPRKPVKWALSNAVRQWGSCSARGSVHLSWRLIYFDNGVIDYVIAHELAHLVHMNHSNDFWHLVSEIDPSYLAQRAKLKGVMITELPI